MIPTTVVYATKTGHSRKLAEAIAQAVGTNAQALPGAVLAPATALLFMVGGIYANKNHPSLIDFAKGLSSKTLPKVVLVTTSVSISHRKSTELREVLVAQGVEVLDELTCTGSLLLLKAGHPNAADVAKIVHGAMRIQSEFLSVQHK